MNINEYAQIVADQKEELALINPKRFMFPKRRETI
jgi:hypothetical protein